MLKNECILCEIVEDKSLIEEAHLEHSNECIDGVEDCPIRLHSKGPIRLDYVDGSIYFTDGNNVKILAFSNDKEYKISLDNVVAFLFGVELIHIVNKMVVSVKSSPNINAIERKSIEGIEDLLDKIRDTLSSMRNDDLSLDSSKIIYAKD